MLPEYFLDSRLTCGQVSCVADRTLLGNKEAPESKKT